MNRFTKLTGIAAPLFRANIDTDQIIPKQFLTRIERTGYGQFLFNDWRFGADGRAKTDFVLEMPQYKGASILIAGSNFGCGSSREHAAWSLTDFGIKAVLAPSFGDIFYNNSLINGLLPVRMDEAILIVLSEKAEAGRLTLTVDLENKTVSDESAIIANFEIDEFRRYCMLNGLDDIGLTLQQNDAISGYESTHHTTINTAA